MSGTLVYLRMLRPFGHPAHLPSSMLLAATGKSTLNAFTTGVDEEKGRHVFVFLLGQSFNI